MTRFRHWLIMRKLSKAIGLARHARLLTDQQDVWRWSHEAEDLLRACRAATRKK
jgi:hypothetical protein